LAVATSSALEWPASYPLDDVVEQTAAEVTAAFDTAGAEHLPPAEALIRLIDAGMVATARFPFRWHLLPVSAPTRTPAPRPDH
jgi:hypothetical protein